MSIMGSEGFNKSVVGFYGQFEALEDQCFKAAESLITKYKCMEFADKGGFGLATEFHDEFKGLIKVDSYARYVAVAFFNPCLVGEGSKRLFEVAASLSEKMTFVTDFVFFVFNRFCADLEFKGSKGDEASLDRLSRIKPVRQKMQKIGRKWNSLFSQVKDFNKRAQKSVRSKKRFIVIKVDVLGVKKAFANSSDRLKGDAERTPTTVTELFRIVT